MKKYLALTICFVIALTSCAKKEEVYTPNMAEDAFVAFCKKESNLEVTTHIIDNTLWVYLPLNESLFMFKADSRMQEVHRSARPLALLSLDSLFTEQKIFEITYDIIADVLPAKPTTYGSTYNENFTRKRQNLYYALQETFFNLPPEKTPEFIVMLIADTTSGIATKTILNLQDTKKFMSQALPFEEYYMREVSEIIGDQGLINDITGRSIAYEAIDWPFFLKRQIENRIRFRFTESDFKPDGDPNEVIATTAANTLRFYPTFTEYTGVTLINRREKQETTLTKNELKAFEEKTPWEETQGKRHIIRFSPGQGLQMDPDIKEKSGGDSSAPTLDDYSLTQ